MSIAPVALGSGPTRHWDFSAAVIVLLLLAAVVGYLWLEWQYRRRDR